MKKTGILFVVILVLASCTEIVFEEAQPAGAKALKEIPRELWGKFGMVILNEESILEISANAIVNDDGTAYLSDSLIVKKLGDRYVVNVRNTDPEKGNAGSWQAFVLEDKGCGFVKATSFFINSDTYLEQFTGLYPQHELIDGGQSKTIIISPTAAQFNEILANDSVTVSMILERLN